MNFGMRIAKLKIEHTAENAYGNSARFSVFQNVFIFHQGD